MTLFDSARPVFGVAAVVLILIGGTAEAKSSDPAYRSYRAQVDRETKKTFQQNKGSIDPGGVRGKAGGHDLDHQTPVKCGYVYGLPPSEIARADNLRLLPSNQNRSEGARGCK